MQLTLGAPAARRQAIARALWAAYDPTDASGEGWASIPLDQGGAAPLVARLLEGAPAPLAFPGGDPDASAGIIVIPAGYLDEYSGDMNLANNSVVIAGPDAGENERHLGFWAEARPAVALYDADGSVQAIIGRIVEGLPAVFIEGCDWPELENSIAGWLTDVVRATRA